MESYKTLVSHVHEGHPLSVEDLARYGLSAKHASRLAATGWLRHLGRGTYAPPGVDLDRDASLALLARTIPGLHVGARTALNWRGMRHNLSFKETLSLWGDKPLKLPSWFVERFPAHYQATQIFDSAVPASLGLGPLPTGRPDVPVSMPERALLELLSEVGRRYSLEDARNLVESVRNLRPATIEELLSHLTRIKVARLANMFADELGLPWAELARKHSDRLGGGRWVAKGKTGEVLDLKRIRQS